MTDHPFRRQNLLDKGTTYPEMRDYSAHSTFSEKINVCFNDVKYTSVVIQSDACFSFLDRYKSSIASLVDYSQTTSREN